MKHKFSRQGKSKAPLAVPSNIRDISVSDIIYKHAVIVLFQNTNKLTLSHIYLGLCPYQATYIFQS